MDCVGFIIVKRFYNSLEGLDFIQKVRFLLRMLFEFFFVIYSKFCRSRFYVSFICLVFFSLVYVYLYRFIFVYYRLCRLCFCRYWLFSFFLRWVQEDVYRFWSCRQGFLGVWVFVLGEKIQFCVCLFFYMVVGVQVGVLFIFEGGIVIYFLNLVLLGNGFFRFLYCDLYNSFEYVFMESQDFFFGRFLQRFVSFRFVYVIWWYRQAFVFYLGLGM